MNFEDLSRKYESNPIARIIVSAIPRVGGSLDLLISHRWSQIRLQRIDELLSNLQKEVSQLKGTIEDYERIIESEEFYDILYQILDNAIKSRCKESRSGYAIIILSALTQSESMLDLEDLITEIADLRERDYLFLFAINQMYNDSLSVSGETVSKMISGSTPIEAERRLLRFENLGLLDHPRNMMTRRGGMCFEKLALFDKLIKYITNPS